MEDGLQSSAILPFSGVAWSKGEVEEGDDPICCFGPRDGGGGGGRLRKEPWSGADGLRCVGDSVKSSDGVGEKRRPGDCLGLSKGLRSPGRSDALRFGGYALAFCSNKLLRSFTAGVTLVSMSISCELADILKGEFGGRSEETSRRTTVATVRSVRTGYKLSATPRTQFNSTQRLAR
jgi:hypothetical protein